MSTILTQMRLELDGLPFASFLFLSRKYQTWGSGVSVVSQDDRREIKKARKEGRISEAMLDRRAKLKQ